MINFRKSSFCVVALIIGCQLAISIHGVISRFPTVDELGHLPAGVSHWKFERFDLFRVNPPLVRLAAAFPAIFGESDYDWTRYSSESGMRREFVIGRLRVMQVGLSIVNDFFGPRFLCLSFTLLGAVTVAAWVGWVLGLRPALLVLALWCLSPNILAHSATIGPDIGSVSMSVLAGFLCWRFLYSPNTGAATCAGFALGLALLSKLTLITAVVSLPLTVVICLLLMGRYLPERACGRRAVDLLLFWCVALFTLNAGYLFEDSFKPLGAYEFCSEMLGGEGSNTIAHGNRFKDTWLANLPVPLPRNYLLGIDYLKYEVEHKAWSFLNGEWKYGSWPHYYVMTTLFKTPEPTLLAALIGLGVLITGIWRKMVKPEVISMFLFLFIPAAVCFASVSLQGGFNHHHRYVLMIYPPMFALAAYIASPVGRQLLRFPLPLLGPQKRSIAVPLAITLVTLSAASSLRVHPYYTSYFNTLSGGPENGWRLLGFSNIDWGQDILEVDKWLKEHPERRPVVMDLDYFGMNGDLFEVQTSDPPHLPKGASIDEVRRSITETQWWIISVKRLYNKPDEPGLEYLQQIEPVERIAYAYHVYRIDPLAEDSQPNPW